MASSFTLLHDNVAGNLREVYFSGNVGVHAASGVAFTAAQFGLQGVIDLEIRPTSGYVFEVDYTNKKIIAYFADYDAGADGALIDVGAVDLTAVVFRGVARGY